MLRRSECASEAEVVLAHWYRGNLMSALLQSTEAARSPIHTSRAWSVMPMAAVLVASAGIGFGRPFRSNQNTYLLHAVGPSLSSLRDDWLLRTTDPHPIFTAVARLASGRVGFAVESFVLMLAAFTGLYLVASTLLRTASRTVRTAVPSLAVLLLTAGCYLLPHILVPAQSWAHPFRGFGGQFLMSIPSMFQASGCGTLMLLGSGIAVWATTSRLRRPLWVMARVGGLNVRPPPDLSGPPRSGSARVCCGRRGQSADDSPVW